jgi:hypothetical protein
LNGNIGCGMASIGAGAGIGIMRGMAGAIACGAGIHGSGAGMGPNG